MKYAYASKKTTINATASNGAILIIAINVDSFVMQIVNKGYDHDDKLRLYGYRDSSGNEYSVLESDVYLNDVTPLNRKIVIPSEEEKKRRKEEENKNKGGNGHGTGDSDEDGIFDGDGKGFKIPLWAIGLIALLILK